jgi:hypothetical protein
LDTVYPAEALASFGRNARSEMNRPFQIIVTPAGKRLAVLPEEDYLMLLAASEDDEGEPSPEFLNEVQCRRRAIEEGGPVVARRDLKRDPT